MKIRNGFVSNSSSSSYVIIGYPVTIEEALQDDAEDIYFSGDEYGEGHLFMEITPTVRKWLKDHLDELQDTRTVKNSWCTYNFIPIDKGSFLKVIEAGEDLALNKLNLKEITAAVKAGYPVRCIAENVSYHSPDDDEKLAGYFGLKEEE